MDLDALAPLTRIVDDDVGASEPVRAKLADGDSRADATDGCQEPTPTVARSTAQAAGDASDADRSLANWESEGGTTVLRFPAAGESEE